jgi:hypothetical protein
VVLATTESRIAATVRDAGAALYAAEAAIVRALDDMAGVADLSAVLNGTQASAVRDGAPAGVRVLPDGATVDLLSATGMERCGQSACTDRQMMAVTVERPWGADNPRWELYAYGRLSDLFPAAEPPPDFYVLVWVGDDPLERDGDPLVDGGAGTGRGVLLLRAAAHGAHGVRRRVEALVVRTDISFEVRQWRELH